METTPSSTRRITRSQTRASSSQKFDLISSGKTDDSGKDTTKLSQTIAAIDQQKDRTALIDITNDSPIVGVAKGIIETPSSAFSKRRTMMGQSQRLGTPSSGEALLRGQVKTLLQKVEEEAEPSKISLEAGPFFNIHGSPFNLLVPTPANTPQVPNFLFASNDVLSYVAPSPVTEKFLVTEMMLDQTNQETVKSENAITRSLLLDFSEKSGSTDCSSVITYQGPTKLSADTGSSVENVDDVSIWSIQANAGSTRDDDREEEEDECVEEYYDEYKEEEDYLDELCEGMNKMNVVGGITEFKGRHIRFMYNSDDEIQGEEEVRCDDERDSFSPNKSEKN